MLRLQIMQTTYFKSSVSDESVKGASDLIQGGRADIFPPHTKLAGFLN